MTTQEKEELSRVIVELIQTNAAVRAAIMDTACCCPNIVTQI